MARKNIKGYAGSQAWLQEYRKYLGEAGDDDFIEMSKDIAYDLEKFNDPLVIGALIYRLVQERMKTNELFEQILEELREIKEVIKSSGPVPITSKTGALGDVDEKIVGFIRKKGRATAEEVQAFLGYRGRNAASARLNRLYQLGILTKTRAGRKVYYSIGGR